MKNVLKLTLISCLVSSCATVKPDIILHSYSTNLKSFNRYRITKINPLSKTLELELLSPIDAKDETLEGGVLIKKELYDYLLKEGINSCWDLY